MQSVFRNNYKFYDGLGTDDGRIMLHRNKNRGDRVKEEWEDFRNKALRGRITGGPAKLSARDRKPGRGVGNQPSALVLKTDRRNFNSLRNHKTLITEKFHPPYG